MNRCYFSPKELEGPYPEALEAAWDFWSSPCPRDIERTCAMSLSKRHRPKRSSAVRVSASPRSTCMENLRDIMEIMILWNTTQRLKNKTLQHCPTIQVLLIKIIETPGTVLKLEGALPGTVVLYDGLHCLHCGLLNGFLLADADFHATLESLEQPGDRRVCCWMFLTLTTCFYHDLSGPYPMTRWHVEYKLQSLSSSTGTPSRSSSTGGVWWRHHKLRWTNIPRLRLSTFQCFAGVPKVLAFHLMSSCCTPGHSMRITRSMPSCRVRS